MLANILVCGTPGTGKTTLCAAVAEDTNFKHIEVGKIVREHGFHAGWDEQYATYTLDQASEDRLLDELEGQVTQGGCLVDFHSAEMFPESWFQLVIVLQCDNTVLYDRLTARGYSQTKITENVECEIMQVLLFEAQEAYKQDIVVPLQSDTEEQMQSNRERLVAWIRAQTNA